MKIFIKFEAKKLPEPKLKRITKRGRTRKVAL